MRLICPNCGATYEVPDDVIPKTGRDVQCSNCGHTWFERPGAPEAAEAAGAPELAAVEDVDAAPEPEAEQAPEAAPEPDADPESVPVPDLTPEPVAELEPQPAVDAEPADKPEQATEGEDWDAPAEEDGRGAQDGTETEVAPDEDAPDQDDRIESAPAEHESDDNGPEDSGPDDSEPQEQEEVPAPRRQPLSSEAAEILREEVAREQAARRGENLESQPDLGLSEEMTVVSRDEEARRNIARLQGEPVAPVPPAGGSRGDLLPDIEEINSSLRPEEADGAAEPDDHLTEAERIEKTRRRGFRIGFFLVGGVALIAALVYAQSDRIAAAVPAMAPTLDAYVVQVDEMRLWLDLGIQALIAQDDAAAE